MPAPGSRIGVTAVTDPGVLAALQSSALADALARVITRDQLDEAVAIATAVATSPLAPAWRAHQPMVPTYPIRVTADPPTITYTDSTVPGASGDFGGLPQILPTDLTALTYWGAILGARTIAGAPCTMNVSNGHYTATDFYPTGTPNGFDLEMDFTGSVLRMANILVAAGTTTFQLYVDGEAVAASPQVSPSVGTSSILHTTFTWATTRRRRLRFSFGANFALNAFASGTGNFAVSAPPKSAFSAMVLGDSWVEGTGAASGVSAWPRLLALLTGWEVYSAGQGGTAYGPPGADGVTGLTPFGSPTRIRAVAEARPDLLILAGTSNNDSTDTTLLRGYVRDTIAAAQAASPDTRIVVLGAQATSSAPTAARIDVAAAIKAGAQDAGVPHIDPIELGWITGTGTVNAPTGTGNASLFSGGASGSDSAHLNPAGYDYWVDRVLGEVVALLSQEG